MSERDDTTTEQPSGVIVGGSVAALRELAEPPRLSPPELDIIRWYGMLVQRLSGPHTGDERGPAKEPPWMKHGPRIDDVQFGRETSPVILVEGSGLRSTSAVWVDGNAVAYQPVSDDKLLIPLAETLGDETLILIRTPEGDVAARIDTSTS
jgi:hypothetical protein